MKVCLCIMIFGLLLCGCSSQTFETLGPVAHVAGTKAPVREVVLQLPEDAAILTASGMDSIYTCGDFDLCLQVLPSGDIPHTVQSISGFDPAHLTILESISDTFCRYDWSWTAAGENADVICRAAVLDDGAYHYTLCVRADATLAGDLAGQWNALFGSFGLESTAQ